PTTQRIDHWTFTAPAGQHLQFTALPGTPGGLLFDITGPQGALATGLSSSSGTVVLPALPATGTYTVTVRTSQGQTGPYSFTLTLAAQALTLDQVYAGTVVGSGQSQLFALPVSAGQALEVQLQDGSVADRNELYVQLNVPPTRAAYLARSTGAATASP